MPVDNIAGGMTVGKEMSKRENRDGGGTSVMPLLAYNPFFTFFTILFRGLELTLLNT